MYVCLIKVLCYYLKYLKKLSNICFKGDAENSESISKTSIRVQWLPFCNAASPGENGYLEDIMQYYVAVGECEKKLYKDVLDRV